MLTLFAELREALVRDGGINFRYRKKANIVTYSDEHKNLFEQSKLFCDSIENTAISFGYEEVYCFCNESGLVFVFVKPGVEEHTCALRFNGALTIASFTTEVWASEGKALFMDHPYAFVLGGAAYEWMVAEDEDKRKMLMSCWAPEEIMEK